MTSRSGVSQASSRREAEEGFTLIELVVAMGIVLAVMASMIFLFVGSLATVAQAKQRQTATALATQTLERLRALPHDVIKIGVNKSTTAFTNDPNIADKATTPRLLPGIGAIDETLLVSNAQATAPLSNHRIVTQVEDVSYTVGVYVTQAATPQPSFNLTALVTYSTPVSHGSKTVIQRSTAFSPSGCLSTATHPFAGPCQASFSARAGITTGSITVVNPDDPEQPISNLGGTLIGLDLDQLSSSAGIEQTTTLTAAAKTMASSATTGGATTTSGGEGAATAADSDPSSSAAAASDSKTTPSQTSAAQSISGLAGSLSATPTTADTGKAASQVAAGAIGCVAVDGTTIASGQPCASGDVRPQGTAAGVLLDLTGASAVRSFAPFTLASVAASAAPARSVAGRFTTANSATCTSTAPPNCAHASVTRTVGTVAVGGVPALSGGDVGPAAYTNAFSVTGLVETARAESGVGARVPSLTRSAGTLSYWNGTDYTNLSLSTVATDLVLDPPAATMTYKAPAQVGVVMTVDSVIRVSRPRTVTTAPAGCSAAACTHQATSTSTVTADTLYVITVNGVELTRFVLRTDLGALNAQTSYRAAPVA